MLVIVSSMRELRFGNLAQLYDYGLEEEGDFYDYLRWSFFQTPGAVYCIWQVEGEYRSALRLEPYGQGLILAGLETAPAHRNKGSASALMEAVMRWLEGQGSPTILAHIRHDNLASIAVHQRCGFQKIGDSAVFLDGSASCAFGTYARNAEHP